MAEIESKKISFVSQEVDIVFSVMAGVSGGTMYHDLLANRDIAGQHPVVAIEGLRGELDGKSGVSHVHSGYAAVVHEHEPGDVGLGNVDDTSDSDKPISDAVQAGLDSKANLSGLDRVDNTSDVEKPLSSAAITALGLKADSSAVSNVDNTSDVAKPISDATQAALVLKSDKASEQHREGRTKVEGFSVIETAPSYAEVGRVTMTGLLSGVYSVRLAGKVSSSVTGRAMWFRVSFDGTASWGDRAGVDVVDAGDKERVGIEWIKDFSAGDRVVVVTAGQVGGATVTLDRLDIIVERM